MAWGVIFVYCPHQIGDSIKKCENKKNEHIFKEDKGKINLLTKEIRKILRKGSYLLSTMFCCPKSIRLDQLACKL